MAKQQQRQIKQTTRRFDLQNKNQLHLLIALGIAVIGFLLYANTLHHQYALDDFSLIKENFLTRRGTAALKQIFSTSYRSGYYLPDNDLYRPLSKAMFAIEWQLAPDQPSLSHWVNVLIYALTGCLLFYVLLDFFPEQTVLCALTALFFIVHPVHTEVVANIKSRDELLGFLFFLLTVRYMLAYLKKNKIYALVLGVLAFFLSLLSKESAMTSLVLVPLTAWYFTKATIKKQLTVAGAMLLVAIVFMIIRTKILGNVPDLHPSIMDNLLVGTQDKLLRFSTAISILGMYLKLLVFPHPLVSDYSFNQIPLISITNWRFVLSGILLLSMFIYSLVKIKSKDTIAYAILFFLITMALVSNIFVLIGTSFGERLLYTPSLAYCLVAAIGIEHFVKQKKIVYYTAGALVLLASIKVIDRNKAWENNVMLHSTDVLLSPNSARAHYYYGNIISQDEYLNTIQDPVLKKATLDTAMIEMRRTLQIYPQFADALHKIGKIYLSSNQFDSAGFYYKRALALNPGNSMYLNNYGNVLFHVGKLEEAQRQFELSIQTNPNQSDAYSNLGSVYGTEGQHLASQHKIDEAVEAYKKAINCFRKCIEIDPKNAPAYYMAGITYRNIGDETNANYFISVAKQLNPNYK